MTSLLSNGTFFFPGPTEVRPEVMQAMLQPMIAHRGAAFEDLFARMQVSLQHLVGTTRPVYVSSSSATGLMEAGVRCAPAGRVLAIVNGAFSARFAAIVKACDRASDVLDVPWGDVVDLEVLAEHLRATRYAAVTVVHSETSTGALTDVRAVARVAHENGAVCLVDSVTGIGAAELRFDEWELDYVLTGSQKALALPPGLAFAAATPSFIENAARQPGRGLYFDLAEFDAYALKNQTPNTPAISLFFAGDVQLAAIATETMEVRWSRHAEMAAQTYYHYKTHNHAFSVNNPNYDVRPRLGEIQVPTLVICGGNDWITPLSKSEEIAAGIPNSVLEVFEQSGHFPMVEEPEKFISVLRSFVAKEGQ